MANHKRRLKLPVSLESLNPIEQVSIEEAPESDEFAINKLNDGLSKAISRLLKAPPKIRIWEWAEQERKFGASPYRQSKVEAARGPMSWVTEPGVRELAMRGPTQLLKTTLLENTFGYFTHHDPCPMVLFEPIETLVHGFVREKLMPMVRDTDILGELIRPAKGREGDSTSTWKVFPGGSLTIAAARSASNLAMLPFRIALMDEVDKYVATIEGNAVELARQRLTSFPHNSLFFEVCSPTTEDGQITKSYEAGDKRQGVCECPACGWKQTLKFGDPDSKGGIKWPKTKGPDGKWIHHTKETGYSCENPDCDHLWSNLEWRRAISKVRYYQTKTFTCCGVEQHPLKRLNDDGLWEWDEWSQVHYALCSDCGGRAVDNTRVSGTVSNLYSPHKSLRGLAEKFLRVKDDPEKLRVFVNTDLAEAFIDRGEEVDLGNLKNRRRVWPAEMPDDAHAFGLSVDTQDNRLEVLRVAFNLKTEQMFLIDHHRLMGDTSQDRPWEQLADLLKERLVRSDGKAFPAAFCFIDIQGHRRDRALSFVRKHQSRNAMAIQGKSERNGGRSELFPTKMPKLNAKHQVPVYGLSVNTGKDVLQGALNVKEGSSPRYVHISADISDEFLDQVVAETPVPVRIDGKWVKLWKPKHDKARNEGLDLCVYALAALRWMQIAPVEALRGLVFKPLKTVSVEEVRDADNDDVADQEPRKPTIAERALSTVRKPERERPVEVETVEPKPEPVQQQQPLRRAVRRAPPRRRIIGRA